MIEGYVLKNNLIVCRAEKGWSQEDLAKKVGVTRQTISSLEKNKYSPSYELATKLSLAFNKPIQDIIYYEEREDN